VIDSIDTKKKTFIHFIIIIIFKIILCRNNNILSTISISNYRFYLSNDICLLYYPYDYKYDMILFQKRSKTII